LSETSTITARPSLKCVSSGMARVYPIGLPFRAIGSDLVDHPFLSIMSVSGHRIS
jgi:hypothetical protein